MLAGWRASDDWRNRILRPSIQPYRGRIMIHAVAACYESAPEAYEDGILNVLCSILRPVSGHRRRLGVREIETGVSQHYAAYDVLSRIRAGLAEMGRDPDRISPEDLKAVDEFHIGGAEATDALLQKVNIHDDMDVLDIGSGIGGPARLIAGRYHCRVTGVDLTPHFVETARALSAMCGMADRVRFEVGSATALPFEDASFDLALLLHVGMNVPDKAALFAEARRVLRDGGTFAIYEVMRVGDGDLAFPVPWAETADCLRLKPQTLIGRQQMQPGSHFRRRKIGGRLPSISSRASKHKLRAALRPLLDCTT